jgi:uncharacterized protein YbjT (DUF2867 family)
MLLGHRESQRFNESLFAPIFKIMPGKWKSIEARDVAKAMLHVALKPLHEGVAILDSRQLREIAQRK